MSNKYKCGKPNTATMELVATTYAEAEEFGNKASRLFFPNCEMPYTHITKLDEKTFVFTSSESKGACEREHHEFLNNLENQK